MKILNAAEFEEFVRGSEGRVVVDFFATWCGPCKMFMPIFEKVAEGMPEVDFYKVDVDECSEIASELGIMSIPTVVRFDNGEETKRNVGSLSRAALEAFAKE